MLPNMPNQLTCTRLDAELADRTDSLPPAARNDIDSEPRALASHSCTALNLWIGVLQVHVNRRCTFGRTTVGCIAEPSMTDHQ
jgi:hypothetical protein